LLESLAKDFNVPRSADSERAMQEELASLAAADPTKLVPAEPFDDRTELRIGDTVLDVRHVGPAHTDNDLFVYDARRGILHAGDLLFAKHHPFVDTAAGGTTTGWESALAEVQRSCTPQTKVVAGHGPTGTVAALAEQASYFGRVRELVNRERAAGRTRDQIVRQPNTLFATYGFAEEWGNNLGVVFDELSKR
jgi:glyoxylase-like metal-dependent hydrolase (beta-lactamase superfamily II)